MKKILLIIMIIFFPLQMFCQGENNNLVTSNGWFDFNHYKNNKPLFKAEDLTTIINIKNFSYFNYRHPSVSESKGNLLFYTNGFNVFNKNHNTMEGGAYISAGEKSASVIIPHRMNENIYYIFQTYGESTDHIYIENNAKKYLKFFVVDMSKNNGLGKVISSDTIQTEHYLGTIESVPHSNGRDAWLIAKADKIQRDTEFYIYSWLIDINGINRVPVISKYNVSDTVIKPFTLIEYTEKLNLFVSGSGNRLSFGSTSNFIFLSKYDNSIGKIYDPMLIFKNPEEFDNTRKIFSTYYTPVFTPSGKYLYTSRYQLDLRIWAVDSIINNIYKYNNEHTRAWLGIGPDNKIYKNGHFADYKNDSLFIGMIHNPEFEKVNINYEPRAIKFKNPSPNRGQQFTIPRLIVPRINFHVWIEGDTVYCEGDTLRLSVHPNYDSLHIDSLLWRRDYMNRDTVMALGPLSQNDEGWYKITCYHKEIPRVDSVYVRVLPKPEFYVKADKYDPCEGETVTLSTSREFESYLWSTGDTTSTAEVTESGTYSVIITNSTGCQAESERVIEFTPAPELKITGDTLVCPGEKTTLTAVTDDENKLKWNTQSDHDEVEVGAGAYWVRAESKNGCVSYDTITVNHYPGSEITIKGENEFCAGGSTKLSVDTTNLKTIEWSTGSTEAEITVDEAGIYTVIGENDFGCKDTAEIEVFEREKPEVEIAGDTLLCPGGEIVLTADPVNSSWTYEWSNGETGSEITVDKADKYELITENEYGCKDTANIEIVEAEILIGGVKDINFGQVKLNQTSDKSLTLTNNSKYPVTIDDAAIRGLVGNVFGLNKSKLPKTLQPDETLTLTISFTPDKNQSHTDSIYIYISEPCQEQLSCEIRGTGNLIESTVFFPELEGKVDTKNFRIPLKAQIDTDGQSFDNFTYSANVSFDAEMFLPTGLTTGNITSNTVENNECILEIEGGGTDLGNNEKILTEIIGDIILSGKEETPLKINDFSITPDAEITTQDGKLVTTGVCANFLRGVQSFTPDNLQVSPNPATGAVEINVSIYEKGSYTIKLYDQQGRKLREYSWQQDSSSEKILTWDLGELPSGVYNLVLQTKWEVFQRVISVVR